MEKAGYQFTFKVNNDASGDVTGATYTVNDNTGRSLGTVTIGILGHILRTN